MLKNNNLLYDSLTTFVLANEVDGRKFGAFYDAHLRTLLKNSLLYADFSINNSKFVFDFSHYLGVEQYLIENLELLEPNKGQVEIDWDWVDNAIDVLTERIKKELGHEKYSDTLKPFVGSTLSRIEPYFIYQSAFPNSIINPFEKLWSVLELGTLFMITSDEDEISNYTKTKEKTENAALLTWTKNEKFKHKFVHTDFSQYPYVYQALKNQGLGAVNNSSFLQDKTAVLLDILKMGLLDFANDQYILTSEAALKAKEIKALEREYEYYAHRASQIATRLQQRQLATR